MGIKGKTTNTTDNSNASALKKFKLLVWKNYKIQSRHYFQVIVEIFLPLLFTVVLVVVRDIVKSEQIPTPTIYDPFEVDKPPYIVRRKCDQLYFTPNNEIVNKLMDKVRQDYFSKDELNYTFRGFPNEAALLEAYSEIALQTSVQNSTDVHDTHVPVLAGVVFTSAFEDDGKSFSKDIKYALRFPAQQRTDFALISERFGLKAAWFTEIVFPLFSFLGPRAKDSPDGGLPGYWAEGFIFVQQAVDRTLTGLLLDEESVKKVEEYDIRLSRFPYPRYIEDKYLLALQGWLPLLMMLSFVYPVINIAKSIVHEKEKRLKESMKMMGLPGYLHWIAWFVKSFVFLFISIILMTFLLKAKFSSTQQLAVLSGVDPTVLFFILFCFMFQAIGFSFFVSTLASTANSGATAAGVLWFVFFSPYFFIHPRYHILTRGMKMSACFFTNAPVALASQIICMFEGTGTGLQWSTFWEGPGPDDDFSMGDCVTMMLVNAVVYMLLALYIEAVRPGEYGVPLPWNFPLKKWYWTNSVRSKSAVGVGDPKMPALTRVNSHLFETEPNDRAGVSIVNLTKQFKEKTAVNNVNLNMYENQITALLGHNGAGKTTTMSMLTGLFPPTTGTAYINGFDVTTDIQSVRSSLGICPQFDVLFDEMSVEEHLRFFCLLKGYPENLVDIEISRMLKTLGLENKRKAQSHTLSGGMKRKLSVGVALCGGSKVVLLDEPTSGMDPSARRSTWDLIQMEKPGRTILLSTHFMEEADLLGDRIAIMAEGELQCCGSSLFLKKKYGGGYHLVIVKEPNCIVEEITNLLKKRIPDVEIDQNIGAELSYSLPDNKSQYFAEMFQELETRKSELGIGSYGASITTMEEVFIRVGREAERRVTEEFERQNPNGLSNGQNGETNGKQSGFSLDNIHDAEGHKEDNFRNTGFRLILQQLQAMLVKKAIYSIRNRPLLIGQMVIPSLYLLMVLASLKTLPGLENPPAHMLELHRYETFSRTVTTVHCNDLTPICSGYRKFLTRMDHKMELTNDQTFIDHIIKVGERDLTRLNFKYIVGFEERRVNDSKSAAGIELVGFFNNQPFHTPPLAYNFLTNGILTAFSDYSLEITNFPFPYSNLDIIKQAGGLYTIGFQIGYNVGFGMSFLAASYVVFLIMERECRSKHLQFVSGLKFPIFWIANYCVDAVCFLFPCLLIIFCLVVFQVDDFNNFDVMLHFIILLLTYGACVIPFMYLWSYMFTIPATGFTRMAMFNIFTGMATMLCFVIISIPELRLAKAAEMVNNIFLVFPNYAVGIGIVQLSSVHQVKQQCRALVLQHYCVIFPENFCCSKTSNYLGWRIPGVGKNIFYLVVLGVSSFVMLMILESKLHTRVIRFFRKSKEFADDSDETEEMLALEDSDVTSENDRIRLTNLTQLFQTDNLILRDLKKFYGNFTAVDKLCLGVERGQTFGLLGVNGAGKTTTFKMLTGDIPITSGDAFVYSHSVRQSIEKVHQNLGYCPQFDGLIGEMTGRETLRMFARLRGIRESDIDGMTSRLSNSLIFAQHIDKPVQFYSGGNKRKLSTAMALVGNPPIVFLDEPTTGMDPVARRHLWNAIAQVRDSGTSIVLTSHSMEECEALCSRLAIMVNGKFRCLGSPQHLKNKFGEGYTLIAQTSPGGGEETIDRSKLESGRRRSSSAVLRKSRAAQQWEQNLEGLRSFIEVSFPDCILKDIHPGFVHYHLLPSENVTWGPLFQRMEIAKDRFKLDAYSVGQTSLEQVFLNFAKAQVNIVETTKKSKLKFC